MSPRARFVAALIGIVAVVPVAWFFFLSEPGGQPPIVVPNNPVVAAVDAAVAPRAVEIHLGDVQGTVQIRRGLDGGWEDAKSGDVLNPSDGVRTTNGSYAVLVGEETWEVKMEPGTEVGIGELKESITKLLLESGMAKATVKGGGRHTFEVRANNSDAVAVTDGGVFTIASNGKGTVAVGAESGEVSFAGGGRVVIVRAGQQSIVRPGEAPTAPASIPTSLLLKVKLPSGVTPKSKVIVKGETEPGALVEIQGRVIAVDAKGKFELPITLQEGRNSLNVKAKSVGGRENSASGNVELDTTVQKTTIDPNLWKTPAPKQ
ncbi:MAG: FecR domain-containing protein [Archangium sp.]